MHLDNDECEIALLAINIATQQCGERMGLNHKLSADNQCMTHCMRKFSALAIRIEQHQKDVLEEKNDVG